MLVVNTCAFIDSAKQESVDAILEMAELKKTGRCKRLVVTGCLAERYRDELRAEIREIDAVLGTGEVPAIVAAVVGAGAAAGRAARAADAVPRSAGGRSGASRHRRHRGRPRRARLPTLPLRRRHAAHAGHAAALRLREGGRGLRLQRAPSASSRRCAATTAAATAGVDRHARRAGWPRAAYGTAADLAGHDLLRHRPRRARRARPPAARPERGRRARVDPPALPLPDDDHRRRARRDGREREGLQVHRPAAAARVADAC